MQKTLSQIQKTDSSNHTSGTTTSHAFRKDLTMQDKENVNSISDMFGSQHSKQLIESLYIKNEKNFDRTLEQFLSGNIPKDEYKVVVMPKETLIDTNST